MLPTMTQRANEMGKDQAANSAKTKTKPQCAKACRERHDVWAKKKKNWEEECAEGGQKKLKKTGNGNGSCGEASLPLSPARALPNELLMVQLLPSQAHHNKVETGAVKVSVLQHSFCSLLARYGVHIKRRAGSA